MPRDEIIVRVSELSRDRLAVILAESEASGFFHLARGRHRDASG